MRRIVQSRMSNALILRDPVWEASSECGKEGGEKRGMNSLIYLGGLTYIYISSTVIFCDPVICPATSHRQPLNLHAALPHQAARAKLKCGGWPVRSSVVHEQSVLE